MTALSRRSLLAGAVAFVAAPARPQFFDGQTIFAADKEFVLTDIVAPSPTPLREGAEPGANFALEALQALLGGGKLTVLDEARRDRWGRFSGPQRYEAPNRSPLTLQEALLEVGAARVFPQSDDGDLLDRYFAAEDEARAGKRGLWAMPFYAILDSRDVKRVNGFQIYRGAVSSADESHGRVYFNFGDDFRSDLTATVAKGAFRRWRRKEDIETYSSRQVEIRGMVEAINGPSIELRHERQLRLI